MSMWAGARVWEVLSLSGGSIMQAFHTACSHMLSPYLKKATNAGKKALTKARKSIISSSSRSRSSKSSTYTDKGCH